MTMREALLMDFQEAPPRVTFLIVSSMVPRILVAGMLHLTAETAVNHIELVVNRLLFHFSVEIIVFLYAAIMM